ncbi:MULTISPECIES: hypothetical protein [Bacillus]|uniref:DUF1433 domain-containing protein n=1 Tax=Bacillus paranthracis TaxID=2026186 RepID=A0AAJ1NFH8_9BACI|nr:MULTISPECIES: hypothetical protein [Bacillus]MBG9905577.1 hypothetical protein [Bacillus paranthracis]MDG0950319.1 hypothetical protein [Bacillus paranthracis]MDG0956250.1 hypothetical protein [Bacillus paranthracis]QCU08784.1 hypothetical protein BCPR1_03010 [Bacillus paranthracis]TNP23304.1 hypothetical protein FH036_22075 [Bacillus sp. CD3-5]
MGKLKEKNIIILIILAIIALIIGFTIKNTHEKNIDKEKSAKAAIEHMKKEENIDFVVTDVKIETHFELSGSITVRGYDKNDKQNKFYVDINKIQNYKVKTWGKD